ncbi:hypothetical protein PSCICN_06380 [Pseudomonas cichorii]|nr:hypothetical protein PSCICN_06380 [Pseudomonas cichorii]
MPSGETKVVGNGTQAANDASFTGAKGTGQALREVEVSSGGKGAWTKKLNKPEPEHDL